MLLIVICFIVCATRLSASEDGPKMYSAVECARECVQGEPPKICHYNFVLEQYSVLGTACILCTPTSANQFLSNCECVMADGVERMLLTANRMLPGPTIQVCKHDKVVIDVTNKIPGQEVTLHWHGIKQNGSQYYDGVPMVTQCPIPESTKFRYQWLANQTGTYFWHSHSGLQRMEGLYGSIVIREPKSHEVHGDLYDEDLFLHVIVISDWFHTLASDRFPGGRKTTIGQTAINLLINGKGIFVDLDYHNETTTPLEVFNVDPGKRYRFRIINAMSSVCTSILTIEDHQLQLISADSKPVLPVMVDSIISLPGERYDFVLHTDQKPKTYWIQVRGMEDCIRDQVQQFALLQYLDTDNSTLSKRPKYFKPIPYKVVANYYRGTCEGSNPDEICISNLKSAKKLKPALLSEKVDIQIYMPVAIFPFHLFELFTKKTYDTFLMGITPLGSSINNISYVQASSPLLSQYEDIDMEQICNTTNKPTACLKDTCLCTHVVNVPLHSVVEVILIDEVAPSLQTGPYGPKFVHPFHLHGHFFHVMAMGNEIPNVTHVFNTDVIKQADAEGLIKRNLIDPPYKDTVAVPSDGYVVLRFLASNPGFWFFHCHFEMHAVVGMAAVFHVGEKSNLPPVPVGFPKCGDFKADVLNNMTIV